VEALQELILQKCLEQAQEGNSFYDMKDLDFVELFRKLAENQIMVDESRRYMTVWGALEEISKELTVYKHANGKLYLLRSAEGVWTSPYLAANPSNILRTLCIMIQW